MPEEKKNIRPGTPKTSVSASARPGTQSENRAPVRRRAPSAPDDRSDPVKKAPSPEKAAVRRSPAPRKTTATPAETPKRPQRAEPAKKPQIADTAKRTRKTDTAKRPQRTEPAPVLPKRRRSFSWLLTPLLVAIAFSACWMWGEWRLAELKSADNSEKYDIAVYKDGEKNATAVYEAETVNRNGEMYLPVSFLKHFFTVTEYGDENEHSFLITENGEWASFETGTCNATVNGQSAGISAPSFFEDGELYVPLRFFSERMNCFRSGFSSSADRETLTFLSGGTPGFIHKAASAPEKIERLLDSEL